MIRFLLFFLIFVSSINVYPQTQQGYVKTRGRLSSTGQLIPGVRLQGATISIKNGGSYVSGTNGSFSLYVPSETFHLSNVQKRGYLLCDRDVLGKSYQYSSNPLVVVMETPDNTAADRLAAEKKIRKTLQQQLQEKEDEIEALRRSQKITEDLYQKRLQELYALIGNKEETDKATSDIACYFSHIDYDQRDASVQELQHLILEGQLEETKRILFSNQHLQSCLAADAKSEEYGSNRDLAEDLYLLYIVYTQSLQSDSALLCLQKRADIWIENPRFQLEYATEAYRQSNMTAAVKYAKAAYVKFQSISVDNPIAHLSYIADTESLLSLALCESGNQESGEFYCKRAVADYETLEDKTEEFTEPLARAYTNAGFFYRKTNNIQESLICLEKALASYQKLTEASGIQWYMACGIAARELGNAYLEQGDYHQNRHFMELSLSYFHKAMAEDQNIDYYLLLACTYGDYGVSYYREKDFSNSVKYFKDAVTILTQLRDEYNASSTRTYLMDYNKYAGWAYYGMGDLDHCESSLAESLEDYKIMFQIDYRTYYSDLYHLYSFLINSSGDNIDKAATYYFDFIETFSAKGLELLDHKDTKGAESLWKLITNDGKDILNVDIEIFTQFSTRLKQSMTAF